jgi:hypothetical protein
MNMPTLARTHRIEYFQGTRELQSRMGYVPILQFLSYGFNFLPWHSGCWHWQVISDMPLASAQVSLQCFFPSAGMQLQAG